MEAAMLGPQANSRKRRRVRNNDAENRVARALQLTHMGELSSERQALEASPETNQPGVKLMVRIGGPAGQEEV